MKLRLLAAALLLLVGPVVGRPLRACGDKFLLPPRGLSFDEAYRASHPGSIVIYLPAGGPADTAGYAKIQSLLTRVGHRVVLVQAADQLAGALSTAKADIILTSFSEAARAGAGVVPGPIGPVILPVLTAPTKQEMAACKLAYPCALKSSDKPEQFVGVVNSVMNDRVKALALARKRGI
jgi:hypothetical protein